MTEKSLHCRFCAASLRCEARFCDRCGQPVLAPALAPPTEAHPVGFATRLWDRFDEVSFQHRTAKRTARDIAAFFTERALIEETYAKALLKLAKRCPIHERGSFDKCWTAFCVQQAQVAQAHLSYRNGLMNGSVVEFTALYSNLKQSQHLFAERHKQAQKVVHQQEEALKRAQHKVDKLEANSQRTAQDFQTAQDQALVAQTKLFQATNAFNKEIACILADTETVELRRLSTLSKLLHQAIAAQLKLNVAAHAAVIENWHEMRAVDVVTDTHIFAASVESGQPCPWGPPPHSQSQSQSQSASSKSQHHDSELATQSQPPRPHNSFDAEPESPSTRRDTPQGLDQALLGPSRAVQFNSADSQSSLRSLSSSSYKSGSNRSSSQEVLLQEQQPSEPPEDASDELLEAPSLPPAIPADFALGDDDEMHISHEQWDLAALEQLLLSTNLLRDVSADERQLIDDVIRVQLSVPSQLYRHTRQALVADNDQNDSLAISESLLHVSHRLSLIASHIGRTQGDSSPLNSVQNQWLARQTSVLFSSIAWSAHNYAAISIPNFAPRLRELCLALRSGDQSAVSGLQELLGSLGMTDALSSPYPPVLVHRLYLRLLTRTCQDRFNFDSDSDSESDNEDDDIENDLKQPSDSSLRVQLHSDWRQIVSQLAQFRRDFQISERFHAMCFVHVLLECVPFEDFGSHHWHSCARTKQTLGLLVEHCRRLRDDAALVENPASQAPFVRAFSSRLVSWLHDVVCRWLQDYHGMAGNQEVLSQAADLFSCVVGLRNDSPDDEFSAPFDDLLAECLCKSAATMVRNLRASFGDVVSDDDWPKFADVLQSQIETDVSLSAAFRKHVATPHQFSLRTIAACWATQVELGIQHQSDSIPLPPWDLAGLPIVFIQATRTIDEALRQYLPESPGQASDNSDPCLADIVSQLPSECLHAACTRRLGAWCDHQSQHMRDVIAKTVDGESWTPIDSSAQFSAGVVDAFTFVFSLQRHFFSAAESVAPFGSAAVPTFLKVVVELVRFFATQVDASCGPVDDVLPVRRRSTKKSKTTVRRLGSIMSKSKKKIQASLGGGSSKSSGSGPEKSSKSSADSKQSSMPSILDADGLVSLFRNTIDTIAVRVASIQLAIEKCADLKSSLCAACSVACPSLDPSSVSATFDTCTAHLAAVRLRLIDCCAARIVHVDLRPSLERLWLPDVSSSRLRGGPVTLHLEDCMGPVFHKVPRSAFDPLCQQVLRHLTLFVEWLLLFGGDQPRCFTRQDTGMVNEDLSTLKVVFQELAEIDRATVREICSPLDRIVSVMDRETAELTQIVYPSAKSDEERDRVCGVLERRAAGDKPAKKFLKQIRAQAAKS